MVSVIIPTLNEQEELPETLKHLSQNSGPHEIIIVDAGSSDQTCRIGQRSGALIIQCAREQRAAQMNLGAARAGGDLLLFLHADTWLAGCSLARIEAVLKRPGCVGGGFVRRFRSPSVFLRITCYLAAARCRAFGWFLGDQAIFARRGVFEDVGGFRDLSQFEDLDLCRRLKAHGRMATLTPPAQSSARRFQVGALARTWSDLRLTASYLRRGAER